MNMIVGKKQIVLASLVVALGVAVYLNYQFAGEDLDLVTANTTAEEISVEDEKQENYGDAQFVDSKDVEEQSGEDSVSTSAEVGDSEYFSQARLTRTKTRDEAAETLAGYAVRCKPCTGTEGRTDCTGKCSGTVDRDRRQDRKPDQGKRI